MTVEVIEVDPTVDDRWRQLHTNENGSLFTSATWLGAVARTYGFAPAARLVIRDAEPQAGVAFCALDDIRGERLVSFPFSDFADPIGPPDLSARAVASLVGDADRTAPLRMKIRATHLHDSVGDPQQSSELLWHEIAVDPTIDEDARLTALHPKVRQNVRRALREDVRVTTRTDLDALHAFYVLHTAVRTHKYGLLPQPFSFFEELHRSFAPDDRIHTVLAEHDGATVAGIVFIECGDRLYYKFNASMADHLRVRPNELLVWEGMNLAASRGLTGIDLGVSDIDQPGLVRYKRKLAHRECEVISITHPGLYPPTPSSGEAGRMLGNLTELLVRPDVPADVTRSASDVIYRYFA